MKFNIDFSKMKKEMQQKHEEKKDYTDKRFWKLPIDKEKAGSAIIRFLPSPEGVPFVEFYTHFFSYQTAAGENWYVANCATTLKKKCPICAKQKELWNSAFEVDKALAKKRKRKQHFVSNIYIVKDPVTPDNEGKVFLYDFGPQIYEKYEQAMYGVEDKDLGEMSKTFIPCAFFFEKDDTGNNICGADFILKAAKKKGSDWVTYEFSKFKDQSEFLGGDKNKIDEVMSKTYSLAEWTDEKNFPTEDEVNAKLNTLATKVAKQEEAPSKQEDHSESESSESNNPVPFDGGESEEMSDEDYINSLNL